MKLGAGLRIAPSLPPRSKGLPAGPVLPLANVLHAKGNPHVFLEVEARATVFS